MIISVLTLTLTSTLFPVKSGCAGARFCKFVSRYSTRTEKKILNLQPTPKKWLIDLSNRPKKKKNKKSNKNNTNNNQNERRVRLPKKTIKLIQEQSLISTSMKFTTVNHITHDTARPTVNLTTRGGKRYLIGKVPEGTQRIINAVGADVKYPKLDAICITGAVTSWLDIGGLPGLFLTICDAVQKGVKLVGNGALLSYIITTWRLFVFRHGIDLDIINANTDNQQQVILENDEVKILSILISPQGYEADSDTPKLSVYNAIQKLASFMFPKDTSAVNSRDPESYKSDPTQRDLHTHVDLPNVQTLVPFQKAISYCFDFAPVRGTFDAKKAIALGLKPGPIFKDLTDGKSVVAANGDVIKPEQVMGPAKVFPKVLFIDIPSEEYYENTITSTKWFEYENLGLVYHFLGDDIPFDMDKYKSAFVDKFPPTTRHYISHRLIANNVIVNDRFATLHIRAKAFMNENFNLMDLQRFEKEWFGGGVGGGDDDDRVQRLHALQEVMLIENSVKQENAYASKSSNESLFPEAVIGLEGKNDLEFKTLQDTKFNLHPQQAEKGSLKDSVHICTLGTGSALPTIYRNVLSNLLRIPYQNEAGEISYTSIFLDSGENTLGSLLRNFGHDSCHDLNVIFKELRLLHLSHLHADHHLGTISLINYWFEVNASGTLYLIIPWQFMTFIKDWYNLEGQYHSNFDISRLKMFSCEDFIQGKRHAEYERLSLAEFEQKLAIREEAGMDVASKFIAERKLLKPVDKTAIQEMYDACKLESVAMVRAIHCPWAYSSTFKFSLDAMNNETFTVSFSGDTRPNPEFAKVGRNSDLLIHEASLDNELLEEAIAKKHSTAIEAIAVSKLMNCNNLILTHFSSRCGMGSNCGPAHTLEKELRDVHKQIIEKKQPSIFERIRRSDGKYDLEQINICYAYDLMNLRLGEILEKKSIWPSLVDKFESNEKKRKWGEEESS